ncbi:MAG TPA: hypothetical protein PKW44_01225 [Methylophilaceae bacterium]|nr:hypothetical protein [Methylophilaceae bacterium]
MPELLGKAVEARNVVLRMMASFNLFPPPPTQDPEQTLSFEFFYQRRAAFGRRDHGASSFKTELDSREIKNH